MFAGHFGLAASVSALDSGLPAEGKAAAGSRPTGAAPTVPLWALMLSTQLLDVIFVLLLIPGVEGFAGGSGYGQGVIHAAYTHSLAGALLIAGGAGALAARAWGRRGGLLIAATVFSHWPLDLLVHRPDLPLLPGNLGNFPLLGFGLWNTPAISLTLEALLVVSGAWLYGSAVLRRAVNPQQRTRALVAGAVMSALLVLSLLTSALGIG